MFAVLLDDRGTLSFPHFEHVLAEGSICLVSAGTLADEPYRFLVELAAKVVCACHAVLGISGQDVMSKAAFVNDLQLPFPLLADDGDEVRWLISASLSLFES